MRHILILEQFEISKLEHGKTLSLSTPVGEIVLQYEQGRNDEPEVKKSGHKLKCKICGATLDKRGRPFKSAFSPPATPRPKVICLCGSTRFYEYFQLHNYLETMAGHIVMSVGFYPHAQKEMHHSEDVGCTPEQKIALDVLHKQKIDLSDEVLVLDVGGYIGDSTRSEIEHAIKTGKPVRYLSRSGGPGAPSEAGDK